MKNPLKTLKNESGAALMMAIFTVTMLIIIATELMYETNVELAVSSQAINQVKAHYAAKAGVEINLFRLHIYKQVANNAMAKELPASALDMIWTTPFAWPPVVPGEASIADKDAIQSSVKTSIMEGQYFATIASESSKIDLNDLASPLEGIRNMTKELLLKIFTNKMESDEEFQRRFSGFDFTTVINNIQDYVDEDKTGANGDEASLYSELNQPELYPPNRPFKTIEELHMVAGMTDEIYELIIPQVTIYGSRGININYAPKNVLMALPAINEEIANRILERRDDPNEKPFKDEKEFVGFLNGLGVNGNPFREKNNPEGKPLVDLIFDKEFNFRIKSTGRAGKVSREITAVVFDFDKVLERVKKQMPTPTPGTINPENAPTPTPAATATPAAGNKPATKERPTIVYWNEV